MSLSHNFHVYATAFVEANLPGSKVISSNRRAKTAAVFVLEAPGRYRAKKITIE